MSRSPARPATARVTGTGPTAPTPRSGTTPRWRTSRAPGAARSPGAGARPGRRAAGSRARASPVSRRRRPRWRRAAATTPGGSAPGPYWASAPVPSAPAPSPRRGAAVVISGASPLPSGCRSISAAPSAPVAVPTAAPCSARAANRSPTLCAARNTAHAPAVTVRAARITAGGQVVRHRPEGEQRQEKNEGVDGEDGGQRGRREPQFGPVDAVQRRRCADREEQKAEYPGHQPERRSRRRRAPRMLPGERPYPASGAVRRGRSHARGRSRCRTGT